MFSYVGWPFRVVVVLLDLLLEMHGFTVSAKLQLGGVDGRGIVFSLALVILL